MAQRVVNLDSLPFQAQDPADERTLARIKFWDEWERMKWFVELAQKPLKEMTQGEITTIQEEIRAIERKLFRKNNPPPPFDKRKIMRLQGKLLEHLQGLIKTGQTMIKNISLDLWIVHVPKAMNHMKRVTEKLNRSVPDSSPPPSDVLFWLIPSSGEKGLIFVMGQLLENYVSSIRQCPRCSKIFLQLRKTADYCSRECQSQAYASRKRAERKASRSFKP